MNSVFGRKRKRSVDAGELPSTLQPSVMTVSPPFVCSF